MFVLLQYFTSLLLLFLTCLALAVCSLTLDLESAAGKILNTTIPLYNTSRDIQAAWDTIQSRQVLLQHNNFYSLTVSC